MDESTLLRELPRELEYCRHDCDDSSSEDLTPASEDWGYWEEFPGLKTYNILSEMLLEAFKDPMDTLFRDWRFFEKERSYQSLKSSRPGRSRRGKESKSEPKWVENPVDSGGKESISPSSLSATLSSLEQPSKSKRKRVGKLEHNDSDGRPGQLHSMEKRSRKLMPLHNLLACPYFKKDPQRHRACCGFGFSKISYLKGHLYRNHAIPIYCPVCQQSFENIQLRDKHTLERNCEPIEDGRPPDGITPEQRIGYISEDLGN